MELETAIRLGKKVVRRSAAEALYLRSGINLTIPSDIRATLTERCNYRCGYCHHWRQDAYEDEMSLAEWKAALLSIKALTSRFAIQFLGGEPMIVPWFFDLAQFCADEGIDWGVITNGSSLSARRVADLVRARPLNIDISLDSRTAGIHDVVRGVAGSMDHVSAGINHLVEERRKSGRMFAIRIKPTLTRQSMASLPDLVRWAESMPSVLVDISPVRLWRAEEIAEFYPAGPDELAQLDAIIAHLIDRKQNHGAPIETTVAKLRAIPRHFAGEPNGHGVGQCRVGLRSIDIRPNGDVNHCWKFERIGNLRNASMAQIWQDEARRQTVTDTVSCDLFKTKCSTSCLSHRALWQDVVRGVNLVRSSLG